MFHPKEPEPATQHEGLGRAEEAPVFEELANEAPAVEEFANEPQVGEVLSGAEHLRGVSDEQPKYTAQAPGPREVQSQPVEDRATAGETRRVPPPAREERSGAGNAARRQDADVGTMGARHAADDDAKKANKKHAWRNRIPEGRKKFRSYDDNVEANPWLLLGVLLLIGYLNRRGVLFAENN